MQFETSFDRKIFTLKEFIKRWREITEVLTEIYGTLPHKQLKILTEEKKVRFYENVDWCSRNYNTVRDAETDMTITHPKTGFKETYPVITNCLIRLQMLEAPKLTDLHDVKAVNFNLKAMLGALETYKESMGEIRIEEYSKFKSLIERLRVEYSLIDSLIELAESSEFLGLGFEWILSTTALQLQEVALILSAKQIGIKLDKSSVSGILEKQFEKDVPFKDKYLAFCKEIKRTKDVTLPMLPTDLRGMRTRVLHIGIPPQTSETKLLTDFTCSFLKDLHACMEG